MAEVPAPEKRVIGTEVGRECEGMRLDHYLRSRFTYRSRTEWQESVKKGEIRINGCRIRPCRRLHAGEYISFAFPEDLDEPEVCGEYRILLEHPRFLAVDKPGNLPVHPAGRFYRNTLLFLLRERYGKLFPVNRLDRETSGVVLFGRDSEAAALLSELFIRKQVEKKYLVFVHGSFPEEGMNACGFLSGDPESEVRKKRRFSLLPNTEENTSRSGGGGGEVEEDDEKKKEERTAEENQTCEFAETEFRFLGGNGKISMLEALPKTGRLHQIRATLCSLGWPLVGDKLYGLDEQFYLRHIDENLTEQDRQILRLDRQALHASRMIFPSPFGREGERISLFAPLPPELTVLQDEIKDV